MRRAQRQRDSDPSTSPSYVTATATHNTRSSAAAAQRQQQQRSRKVLATQRTTVRHGETHSSVTATLAATVSRQLSFFFSRFRFCV